MKVAVCVLAIVASTLASPVPEETIDWFNIKPINIYVDPVVEVPRITGSRVIGGTVAPRNSIPYQAAIIINNSGFCGGSLISTTVVLTAAHCIDSAVQTQVILGAHSPLVAEATQRVTLSTDHIVHPRWISFVLQNDIGFVRISAVTLTPEIQLSALAPANAGTYEGALARLSGWGRTSDATNNIASELQEVNLSVISNDECRDIFSVIIQPQHICTSGGGVVGACNGDSGGPLVVSGVQVGIVSFGAAQCESQSPTAYARVSHFREWIQETVNI